MRAQRSNLCVGSIQQHKRPPVLVESQHLAGRLRAGKQRAPWPEREGEHMCRVALEEHLALTLRGDAVDAGRVPGRRIQGPVGRHCQRPDIRVVRVKDRGALAVRCHSVDPPVRRGGREHRAPGGGHHDMDVELVGIEDDAPAAIGFNAIEPTVVSTPGPERPVRRVGERPEHRCRRIEELVGHRTEDEVPIGIDRQRLDVAAQKFRLRRHTPEGRRRPGQHRDVEAERNGEDRTPHTGRPVRRWTMNQPRRVRHLRERDVCEKSTGEAPPRQC